MEKTFKKESYIEKYEKDLILCGLFLFIIFSVISFVFIMPRVKNFYGNLDIKGNHVERFQTKNSGSPAANYKAGLRTADNSMALDYFKRAVAADPNNINYLTELAITHYRLKNYKEAIDAYNKVISLDKNNVSAYNSLGNIYWIRKDFDMAETYFSKAIELDLSSIASYNNLALMLDENGKKDEAIAVLNKGLENNSNNSELKLTLKIIEAANK